MAGVPGLAYPAPPKPGGSGPFGLTSFASVSPLAKAAASAKGPPHAPQSLQPGGSAQWVGAPPPNGPSTAGKSPGSPGYVSPYDLNTDPGLAATNALAGLSDQQANAAATKSESDLLLSYGDPNLIAQYLHDPNLAAAAAKNPNSTIAQLGAQHKQAVTTLDDQLNKANLSYSGYRVTQEQQAENDYQGQLAQAASQVNSGLDSIQGSLAQALAADNAQRIAAIAAAQGRADASGTDPGASGSTGGTGAGSHPGATASSFLGGGSPAAKKALAGAAAKAVLPQTPNPKAGTKKGERPT